MKNKTIRITADIDNKSILNATYYTIKSLLFIKKIKKLVLKRSHNNNFHLIIWTNFPYTEEESFKLRKKIGDDSYRLKMDKQRTTGRNTLFYKKEKINKLNNVIKQMKRSKNAIN